MKSDYVINFLILFDEKFDDGPDHFYDENDGIFIGVSTLLILDQENN